MNKNEFVNEVYTKTGLSKKDCRLCLETIMEVIKNALRNGESVTLSNFGKFKVSQIKPKSIYSFKTKTTEVIEARKTPSFKASENLKQIEKKKIKNENSFLIFLYKNLFFSSIFKEIFN